MADKKLSKAVVISNIPIALASAMSSAILPAIASCYARKEMKQARENIADAIKILRYDAGYEETIK